jgi:deazaflavin-dependent oxidoreductase (nitroreductase family)
MCKRFASSPGHASSHVLDERGIMNDFNDALITEYRATGGKVGGPYAGAELLVLHTLGAKTGKPLLCPVTYRKEGDTYYVFASYSGNPKNPAWYHNLIANPDTVIEIGEMTVPIHATEIRGEERSEIYNRHASKYALFATYPGKTDRTIPVLALTPTSAISA